MRPVNLRAARRQRVYRRPLPRRGGRGPGRMVMAATAALLLLATPWLGPAMLSSGSNVQLALGLVTRDVHIVGIERVADRDVQEALAIAPESPILEVELAAVRSRLEDLAWIDRAVVRRVLPDAIEVEVVEHRPLALWLGPDGMALLAATGETVAIRAAEAPRDLPVITGVGAPADADAVKTILQAAARLDRPVRRLDRIARQRWRLILEPHLRIELPSRGVDTALARLQRHALDHELLEQPIAVIDLRLEDRVVVTPLPILRRTEAG